MLTLRKKANTVKGPNRFASFDRQVKAWRKANRKMGWGITKQEFETLPEPPALTESDIKDGFFGVILSYGFGDDGAGYSDAVLSGRMAWEYAGKRRHKRTWQCQYIDFGKADHFRLRLEAPKRPKGFYCAKLNTGESFISTTVSKMLKSLENDTGCGPEGIQFLAITHPNFADLMNTREIPFMAFADYDVAPYGFNDFFDALQMFCSNDTLGLGIGNIDHNYPLFGIPVIRF